MDVQGKIWYGTETVLVHAEQGGIFPLKGNVSVEPSFDLEAIRACRTVEEVTRVSRAILSEHPRAREAVIRAVQQLKRLKGSRGGLIREINRGFKPKPAKPGHFKGTCIRPRR